jgi:hypothetical protein
VGTRRLTEPPRARPPPSSHFRARGAWLLRRRSCASRSRRSSGANGCAFKPSTPPARNSSRHAASRWASTRSSRLSSSRPSPRCSRITASALRFADQRTSRGCSASATPTLPISTRDLHSRMSKETGGGGRLSR